MEQGERWMDAMEFLWALLTRILVSIVIIGAWCMVMGVAIWGTVSLVKAIWKLL